MCYVRCCYHDSRRERPPALRKPAAGSFSGVLGRSFRSPHESGSQSRLRKYSRQPLGRAPSSLARRRSSSSASSAV